MTRSHVARGTSKFNNLDPIVLLCCHSVRNTSSLLAVYVGYTTLVLNKNLSNLVKYCQCVLVARWGLRCLVVLEGILNDVLGRSARLLTLPHLTSPKPTSQPKLAGSYQFVLMDNCGDNPSLLSSPLLSPLSVSWESWRSNCFSQPVSFLHWSSSLFVLSGLTKVPQRHSKK